MCWKLAILGEELLLLGIEFLWRPVCIDQSLVKSLKVCTRQCMTYADIDFVSLSRMHLGYYKMNLPGTIVGIC